MIRATALALALPAAALAGPAEDVAGCLAASDAAFAAGAGGAFDIRWDGLRGIVADESACLNRAIAACAHADGEAGCFPALRGALSAQHAQAMSGLPLTDEVEGRLAEPYARWRDERDRSAGRPDGGAGHCPLHEPIRAEGCPVMAEAALLLRARDWARVFDLMETLE
ncbi:hypothetical protein E7811_11695 [Aliigemmobacter aestuarii]|uniref:DUF1311 domain-containing protein n=1 Tax=Aliigemmobacter aestuarii TaxID=1445661 RepID=A0A4S3ML61_9RHOB|nr:hypothetical protein [Gemmobacter aestuarii]THD82817.1 hypothetical protein E7811_11695 [Gemmobacter aestuarii]